MARVGDPQSVTLQARAWRRRGTPAERTTAEKVRRGGRPVSSGVFRAASAPSAFRRQRLRAASIHSSSWKVWRIGCITACSSMASIVYSSPQRAG